MGKHKELYHYWLSEVALPLEKLLSYEDQIYALQMWLQSSEDWSAVQEAFNKWDENGNPPPRTEATV